jgi:cephalosporin hydroxylase
MQHPLERFIAEAFHLLYYFSPHTWNGGFTKWMGVAVLQNPFDMWVLQEVIYETKPDLIIETGSAVGGTASFYVSLFPKVRVISIDTQEEMKPEFEHPRISFLKGMSTDKGIVAKVKKEAAGKRVMVVLDSDHTTENVLAEMKAYSGIVTRGCYMVVCDSNLGGNPVINPIVPGPGPMAAIQKFMDGNKQFEIDKSREKFFMTFFPNGWLRKL